MENILVRNARCRTSSGARLNHSTTWVGRGKYHESDRIFLRWMPCIYQIWFVMLTITLNSVITTADLGLLGQLPRQHMMKVMLCQGKQSILPTEFWTPKRFRYLYPRRTTVLATVPINRDITVWQDYLIRFGIFTPPLDKMEQDRPPRSTKIPYRLRSELRNGKYRSSQKYWSKSSTVNFDKAFLFFPVAEGRYQQRIYSKH